MTKYLSNYELYQPLIVGVLLVTNCKYGIWDESKCAYKLQLKGFNRINCLLQVSVCFN